MSTSETIRPLPMASASVSCACCAPDASTSAVAQNGVAAADAVEASFAVEGMTCSHCVSSVSREVGAIPGVGAVTVDLVANGVSTVHVTSASAVPTEAVQSAIEEAGYTLVAGVR
ncbi:MAG: heavy-metal-associated domain-containing protein [Microbacteriaceae bacterium]